MTNKIEQMLKESEGMKSPEEFFIFLESQKISDEELRKVIDTKYFGDRVALSKAYVYYGERLIDPAYVANVRESILSSSRRPIHSSAKVL